MIVIRTKRAIDGFFEVSSYIASTFGPVALRDFRKRVRECTKIIKARPGAGRFEWEISSSQYVYQSILVYRRSWMVYRVEGTTIYIVDFYDTRKSTPSGAQYE